MPDFKSMYFSLFNSVTDAIEILKAAQQKGEESYISYPEKKPITFTPIVKDKPNSKK